MGKKQPAQIQFVIASISLAVTVLFFSHAAFDPRATVSEFAGAIEGWIAILGVLLSVSVYPALQFASRKETEPNAFFQWLREMADSNQHVAIAIVISITLLMLIGTIWLHRSKTDFEKQADIALFAVHEQRTNDAQAAVSMLRRVSSGREKQVALIELATLALEFSEQSSSRSFTATGIEKLRSSVAAWQDQNAKYFNEHVLLLRVRLDLAQGRMRDGESQLAAFVRENNGSERSILIARYLLGDIDLGRQQYEHAKNSYGAVIARATNVSPHMASLAYRKRGICQALRLNWEGAQRDFRSALEGAGATLPIVHSNLGFAYMGGRKFEEAEVQFQQAMRLDPCDVVPLLNYSIVLSEQGRFAESRDALAEAWMKTNRDLNAGSIASNAVLTKLIQAWVQIRENSAYTTGFIQYVREAKGLIPEPKAIAGIVDSSQSAMSYHLDAAEGILENQNLYGLEFMAWDILVAAREKYPQIVSRSRYQRLEERIPDYARAWRL